MAFIVMRHSQRAPELDTSSAPGVCYRATVMAHLIGYVGEVTEGSC